MHSEPEDQQQRLMVAANMRINDAGNSLIARDTTIMPNIPDLPALACMIFTPTMELRQVISWEVCALYFIGTYSDW